MSSHRQLPSGIYSVRSVEADKFVGHIRPPHGGHAPQKLVVLADDAKSQFFHFARREDGTYVISVEGLSALEIEGKVYVQAVPHDEATSWAVEAVPDHHDGRRYTCLELLAEVEYDRIKNPSFPQGWAVNDKKPHTQVAVDVFERGHPVNTTAYFDILPILREGSE
ncbi:hypothetical protein EIP86_005160 [Pleurotus ostreatoroseus]|nr:hypothetical protein EIP86_005160 [Pleurotus ostreatoroseus]